MTNHEPLEQRLAQAVIQALRPPRFPFRRDFEIAGRARSTGDHVSFHEAFWSDPETLTVVAVRISTGGLDGAIRATCLRQLIRAAASVLDDACAMVDAAHAAYARYFPDASACDVALVRVRAAQRWYEAAMIGQGFVGYGRAEASGARGDLRPDVPLLVRAGLASVFLDRPIPVEGPQSLIDEAFDADPSEAAAAVAIVFRQAPADRRELVLSLLNEADDVEAGRGRVEAFCEAQGVPEEASVALGLALDELLTNVLSYAFSDGGRHEIVLSLRVDDASLYLEIRDDGQPFDPLQVADPALAAELEDRPVGGLGMHFVRQLVDEMIYRRQDGWNVVNLRKSFVPLTVASTSPIPPALP